MEVDAKNQHERAVKFDFHTGVDELAPLPQIGRDCDGVGRARGKEDLRQLRRAGLGQRAVELEEARRLAEPVDLALAQRRRRLADVVASSLTAIPFWVALGGFGWLGAAAEAFESLA